MYVKRWEEMGRGRKADAKFDWQPTHQQRKSRALLGAHAILHHAISVEQMLAQLDRYQFTKRRTDQSSAPSRSHCRVKPLQLHAGVGGGELPIGFDVLLVAAVLPGGDFLGQGRLVRDTTIETLTRQHAEFGLGHVQPGAVSGRIVLFEPLDEAARLGRSFVE
jgi:hypothetical protein